MKIVIQIRGGMLVSVLAPAGENVQVELFDWDNLEDEESEETADEAEARLEKLTVAEGLEEVY